MSTKLGMSLKFGNYNGTMSVNISANNKHVISIIDPQTELVDVDCAINLPCTLTISLAGKNTNDTKVENNIIVADKYVQLTKMSLGNIPINPKILFEICNLANGRKDTYWGVNGDVTIHLNEENFILWHLKNKNVFDL